MTIDEFLRQLPCLEELDGYLDALKPGSAVRQLDLERSHEDLTPDVLRAAEDYRKRLMKGLVVPAPSSTWRAWEYRSGKAPRQKTEPPPVSPAQSSTAGRGSAPDDRPAGHAGSQQTYLVAKPRW